MSICSPPTVPSSTWLASGSRSGGIFETRSSNNGDKLWQILFTDADENGLFKVTVPHPGIYTILADGRAGFNDAFWELNNVIVGPGITKTVKLSRPEESCLPLL
jgi:hypothetical protein